MNSTFIDWDGNGALDSVTLVSAGGPTSLSPGVIGDLRLTNGVVVASTNTVEKRYYRFENVPPGAVSVLVSRVSATLVGVPQTEPSASDVTRNRALPDVPGVGAYITYAVVSGYGVLASLPGAPLNFGFEDFPLSTALDLSADLVHWTPEYVSYPTAAGWSEFETSPLTACSRSRSGPRAGERTPARGLQNRSVWGISYARNLHTPFIPNFLLTGFERLESTMITFKFGGKCSAPPNVLVAFDAVFS